MIGVISFGQDWDSQTFEYFFPFTTKKSPFDYEEAFP
jgi:hypothetical protein